MSRYIDADAFINEINERRNIQRYIRSYTADDILTALNNFHTAEVKPIIPGEWEYYQMGDFQCTNCGFIKYDAIEFNFCPNCGADMRKESEEEE